MKKISFLPITILIAGLSMILGCKKESFESEETAKAVPGNSLQKQCQLISLNVDGFYNQFHYNEKGLVDEWRMHFGDGIPQVYTMTYNNNNELAGAWMHYEGNLIATIDFTWKGNLLTDEHWNWLGFEFDYLNTYNSKGQRIKSEGTDGFSAISNWYANGNVEQTDILFNGELLQRAEYTYDQPNKNPYNAIRGLPYGFPILNLIWGKCWETSEKVTVNAGGWPLVVYELDPSQTAFQFGPQNYLTSANHFDLISNSPINYSFEYQNCGLATGISTQKNNSFTIPNPDTSKKSIKPLLFQKGSLENIRKNINPKK
jgi:hypothetical protein